MRAPTTRLTVLAALALAGVAGCGGNSASDAPNYGTVAFDMESADGNSADQALGGNGSGADQTCHPHLFDRTREVVGMINHHFWKGFRRLDPVLALAAKLESGKTRTWEHTTANVTVKATVVKAADSSYTLLVEAKEPGAADSTFVTIVNGTFTPASDGTPHAGSGTLTIDLSAITKLVPSEVSSGQLAITYTLNGDTKVVNVAATDFQPDAAFPVRPPRSAHFVYARTKGVGGSLKFTEDVNLFCPANPDAAIATVETVARWSTQSGTTLGRADSLGTGGQIAAGSQWMGLTCFNMSKPDATAETYWQMKEETGSTIVQADSATDAADGSSTCASTFGAVPALDSTTGDFDFSSVVFTDGSVVPYPGMPAASTSGS